MIACYSQKLGMGDVWDSYPIVCYGWPDWWREWLRNTSPPLFRTRVCDSFYKFSNFLSLFIWINSACYLTRVKPNLAFLIDPLYFPTWALCLRPIFRGRYYRLSRGSLPCSTPQDTRRHLGLCKYQMKKQSRPLTLVISRICGSYRTLSQYVQ